MTFRTEFEPASSGFMLNPQQPVVLIGSCFSDYIGERMRFCRWKAFPNPAGTLYNPSSIANILKLTANRDFIPLEEIENSLAQKEKLWISWLSDSGCTSYSMKETRERIIYRMQNLSNLLKKAKTLIVTFGTAWVYELRELPGYIVSNCHKFPSDTFLRRRLSISEISTEWNGLLKHLSAYNPQMKFIFTVSPVRHLKDGFEGNSSSKAILRLACEEICNQNDKAEYFPAFEIMNDDLRDYRFYGPDMVHPSDKAVDYIWQKFQDRFLTEESRRLLLEGEKVTRRLLHRPILYGNSEMAQYHAALQKSEASDFYNDFILKYPDMLPIDE